MLDGIRQFWNNQVGSSSYAGRKELSGGQVAAAGAAVAVVGAGIGYEVGAHHEAADHVTHTYVPYPETVTVQDGTTHETGGFHYHYSFSKGGFEYGYDPFWSHDEPHYVQQQTGRTLYNDVKHHTVGAPYTALQGAAMGFGIGAVLAVGGAVLHSALQARQDD
jgi:hypothetical protein